MNLLKVYPNGEIQYFDKVEDIQILYSIVAYDSKYMWLKSKSLEGWSKQYSVGLDGQITSTGRVMADGPNRVFLVDSTENISLTIGMGSIMTCAWVFKENPEDGSIVTTSNALRAQFYKPVSNWRGLIFSYQTDSVYYNDIPSKFMLCRVNGDTLSIETVGLYQNENSQQIKPDVLFTPDGKWFAAIRDARYVDIYPILSDGQLDTAKRYSYTQNADYTLTCTPDSMHIYSGCFDGLSSTPGRIGRFDYSEDSGCFIQNGEYVFTDGSQVLNADVTPDGRLMVVSLQVGHGSYHKIITMHVSPTGDLTPTGYEFMYSQICGDIIPIEPRTHFLLYPLPTSVPVHQWGDLN